MSFGLHHHINDDPQTFQNAFTTVTSLYLVELQAERMDPTTGEIELARYSTLEMIDVEHAMADRVEIMKHERGHGVDRHHVDHAIEKQDAAIRASVSNNTVSAAQRGALNSRKRDPRLASLKLADKQSAPFDMLPAQSPLQPLSAMPA